MNGAFWAKVAQGIVVVVGAGLALGVWNMSSSVTVLATKFDGFTQQIADHEKRIRSLEFTARPTSPASP